MQQPLMDSLSLQVPLKAGNPLHRMDTVIKEFDEFVDAPREEVALG